MKQVVLMLGMLFALLHTPSFANQDEALTSRVIGGQDAATTDHDFFVSFLVKYEWSGDKSGHHWNPVCGGSYLGEDLIVTAAHCLGTIPDGAVIGLLPGNRSTEYKYEYCTKTGVSPYQCIGRDEPNLTDMADFQYTGFLVFVGSESDVIQVTRSYKTVAIHKSYNRSQLKYDIALIRIPTSIPYDSVTLTEREFSELPATATVIGHGNTSTTPASSQNPAQPDAVLQQVELPLVSDTACKVIHNDLDNNSMLCAGYFDGRDDNDVEYGSCHGDSGGPLFVEAGDTVELVGIVSHGRGCANSYGVYTDVVNMKKWVSEKASSEWKKPSSGGSLSYLAGLMALMLIIFRYGTCRRLGLIVLAVIGITGCSSNPFKNEPPEVLFNPVLSDEGLEFSVVSTGCTEEEHLYLRVKGDEIEVRRTQPDMCRMAPHLVRFMMPLPEGESVWQIQNPVRYSNRTGGLGEAVPR